VNTRLIRISKGLIVSPTEILRAERNGNYTDLWIRGKPSMESIWDEAQILWEAICDSASNQPQTA